MQQYLVLITIIFLSYACPADDIIRPTDEVKNFVNYIISSNSSLKNCEGQSGAVTTTVKGSQLCEAAASLNQAPKKLALAGGPEFKVCSLMWNAYNAAVDSPVITRKKINTCGTSEDRFTPGYVPPSSTENLKTNVSRPDGNQDEMLAHFKQVQGQVADECCKGEHQYLCQRALARAPFRVCQPPKDPTAPDFCASIGTSYQIGPIEAAIVYGELTTKYKGSGDQSSKFLQSKIDKEDLLSEQERRAVQDVVKINPVQTYSDSWIQTGEVWASPYLTKDAAGKVDWIGFESNMTHELGHACSHINTQIRALMVDGKEGSDAAVRLLDRYSSAQFCKASEETKATYRRIYSSLGSNADVTECLMKSVALQAAGKGVYPPCPNFCEGTFYEETAADLTRILNFQQPLGRQIWRMCSGFRDAQHPATVDILECLTTFSSDFRDRIKSKICGAQ